MAVPTALIERQTAVAIDDVDVDFVPHVQGIASSLDDLILNGSSLRAQLGDAVVDGQIERTIEGASTVTIDVKDDSHALLQSALLQEVFDVELDGLGFRFVKASEQGKSSPLSLQFEDREVARLRKPKGPRKAFRGKMTRAEFSRRLVRELKPPIPFYCPMLHKVQPIGSAAGGRKNQQGKLVRREPGLDRHADLTIKGEKADAGQIRNMDRALDVATSLHADKVVKLALLVAGMAESLFRDLSGGDADSTGFLQQRPSQGWGPRAGVEEDARDFLKGRGGNRGALAIHRSQPNLSAPELAQAVQRSGAPGAYRERMSEAVKALNAYIGSDTADGDMIPAKDQGKFQFERKKNESTWDCIGRLADEVKWRRFCSGGVIYYIAETDLLASKRRMLITPDTPGLEDFRFDYDHGKPITEITASIRARAIGLPPGTAAEVQGMGPADGRYIASKLTAPLRKANSLCDVTLTTPTAPLPEPVLEVNRKSKRKGKTAVGGKGGDGGLPEQVRRMKQEIDRIDALRLAYQYGGGHRTPAPANGPFDCSSFVSRILQVGGFHNATMVSGALARWGAAGDGRYVTIYANAAHVFMALRLTDGEWHFAGTSHENHLGGPGWHSSRSASGFSLRHPPGF